ncbi:MAG TPA: apolipoprotein N-acyltransferase [Rheinheimera sp.]|nr:apolipoprotein N-acyltransferase [Rheinheimera sp.]
MLTRISSRSLLIGAALFAIGLTNTLAFAPYQMTMLPLLTLALLAFAVSIAESKGQAAWFGFAYGLGWFATGVSWVHVSIATFGGMPLVASLSIMALLVLYLSIYPLAATMLAWLFAKRFPQLFAVGFAASWTFAENLRSWVFTGFPWLSLGYSQTESWFGAWAAVIGENGISFMLALCAAVPVLLLRHRQQLLTKHAAMAQVAVAVFLAAMSPLIPAGVTATGELQAVSLVQGNIKQELRWDPAQELPTMKKYMELTKPLLNNRLVIWPEAGVPQIEPLAQGYLINLDMQASEHQSAVVTGILDLKRSGDAYNGMIVLGQQDPKAPTASYYYETRNRYQKHHLLPIGEFVPFESLLRDIAPFFDLPNSSFSRGQWQQPNLRAKGRALLPALCFEIAFPRQILANFRDDTHFILTVSNDAWFGDSHGPWQHLQIAQMRAREFGRPVLRATNTGVTATIDANGKIRQQAPQFTEAVLNDDVPLYQGRTVYSLIGDSLLYLVWLLLAGLFGFSWLRQRQNPASVAAPRQEVATTSVEPAQKKRDRIEPKF